MRLGLLMLIQLPRIDKIMPNAVKAADHSRNRGKEREAHPNRQDGVLLPQRLPRTDFIVITRPDPPADVELQQTADQGGDNEPQLRGPALLAMHDTAHRDGRGQRQGHRPKVERQFLIMRQDEMQPRRQITDQNGGQQRHQQKRKHLTVNEQGRCPHRDARTRMHVRHQGRHNERDGQIDENRIGGQMRRITASLLGDDRAGRGRGADDAYHDAFNDHAHPAVRHQHQHGRQDREDADLEQQQQAVPRAQPQLLRIDLAERQEQHREYQQRLQQPDRLAGQRMRRLEKRDVHINEIARDTGQHREYQHPILDEPEYCLHRLTRFSAKIRISRVQCQIYLSIAEAGVSKTKLKIRISRVQCQIYLSIAEAGVSKSKLKIRKYRFFCLSLQRFDADGRQPGLCFRSGTDRRPAYGGDWF